MKHDGGLDTAAIYNALKTADSSPDEWSQFVWKNKPPPPPPPARVKFFAWLLAQGRIQCKTNLIKKNIVDSAICDICHEEDESPAHVIFGCSSAQQFWDAMGIDTSREWQGHLAKRFKKNYVDDRIGALGKAASFAECLPDPALGKGRVGALRRIRSGSPHTDRPGRPHAARPPTPARQRRPAPPRAPHPPTVRPPTATARRPRPPRAALARPPVARPPASPPRTRPPAHHAPAHPPVAHPPAARTPRTRPPAANVPAPRAHPRLPANDCPPRSALPSLCAAPTAAPAPASHRAARPSPSLCRAPAPAPRPCVAERGRLAHAGPAPRPPPPRLRPATPRGPPAPTPAVPNPVPDSSDPDLDPDAAHPYSQRPSEEPVGAESEFPSPYRSACTASPRHCIDPPRPR
ncbi:extensin-like [Miscanthus floridulus]|uniref:extensin-like n=1 Tax=Miscanthus floridulus TaxID=154761 RepID=UPI00345779D6